LSEDGNLSGDVGLRNLLRNIIINASLPQWCTDIIVWGDFLAFAIGYLLHFKK